MHGHRCSMLYQFGCLGIAMALLITPLPSCRPVQAHRRRLPSGVRGAVAGAHLCGPRGHQAAQREHERGWGRGDVALVNRPFCAMDVCMDGCLLSEWSEVLVA